MLCDSILVSRLLEGCDVHIISHRWGALVRIFLLFCGDSSAINILYVSIYSYKFYLRFRDFDGCVNLMLLHLHFLCVRMFFLQNLYVMSSISRCSLSGGEVFYFSILMSGFFLHLEIYRLYCLC